MTDSAQPLIIHLLELRRRMIRAVLAWMLATGLCYFFAQDIYQFLIRPLAAAFGPDDAHRLIATSLTETFVTYIKLAMWGGFFLSFPYVAAEIYLFLAPGLFKRERAVLAPYLIAAPILFFLGAALAYYFIMPKAWAFLVSFEMPKTEEGGLPLIVEAKVSEYLALVMHIVLAFGLSFQMPIILTLLVRTGLVAAETLAKGRRYAIVILITVAAVITPPDILSQILLFIPLYGLYELSIIAARAIERGKMKAIEMEELKN